MPYPHVTTWHPEPYFLDDGAHLTLTYRPTPQRTMRSQILFVLATLLLPPLVQSGFAQDRDDRDQETMIDERFSVDEGGTLEVNVGDADVEVVPGASDEVHVEVILAARNLSDKAREYFEKQNFKVTQSGNTVRVETDPRRRIRISWNDWRNHPSIYVRVSVPEPSTPTSTPPTATSAWTTSTATSA